MSGIHILIAIRVRFFYTRNRIRVSSACESTIIRYNYRYWCPACAVLFLNFHLNAVRVRAAIRTDLRGTQRPVHQWDSALTVRGSTLARVLPPAIIYANGGEPRAVCFFRFLDAVSWIVSRNKLAESRFVVPTNDDVNRTYTVSESWILLTDGPSVGEQSPGEPPRPGRRKSAVRGPCAEAYLFRTSRILFTRTRFKRIRTNLNYRRFGN